MDGKGNLAALVTRDAEFDHFEAIREEYEAGLSAFVSSAAKDEMAELEELGRGLPGRRTGALAFTVRPCDERQSSPFKASQVDQSLMENLGGQVLRQCRGRERGAR